MGLNTKLLQSSFEKLKPIAKEVANKFYETLWQDYPESKELFKNSDMETQKSSLIGSLVYIVDHLESPKLEVYLKNMGSRHNNYGAQKEHYGWVGESILKSFAYFFDDEWNKELEDVWTEAYGVISDLMIKGSNEAQEKENLQVKEMDIRAYTIKLCENLLAEVLDDELEALVKDKARPRIKEMIFKALEEESEKLLKKPRLI